MVCFLILDFLNNTLFYDISSKFLQHRNGFVSAFHPNLLSPENCINIIMMMNETGISSTLSCVPRGYFLLQNHCHSLPFI